MRDEYPRDPEQPEPPGHHPPRGLPPQHPTHGQPQNLPPWPYGSGQYEHLRPWESTGAWGAEPGEDSEIKFLKYDVYQPVSLTAFAWVVIISVTVFLVSLPFITPAPEPPAAPETEVVGGMWNAQARFAVGHYALFGNQSQALDMVPEGGPVRQRYASALLVNEISGAEAATAYLRRVDEVIRHANIELSEADLRLRAAVRALLRNHRRGAFEPTDLAESHRQELVEQLGWTGKLALAPEEASNEEVRRGLVSQATRSMIYAIAVGLGAIAACLSGLVLLAAIFVGVVSGLTPAQFVSGTGRSGIYVETFALWLVAFFGLQLLILLAQQALGAERVGIGALSIVAFWLPLLAIFWPVLRGLPWHVVAEDIGLTSRKWFMEAALGVVGYIAALPLLIVGIVITFLLITLFAPVVGDFESTGGPAHPIVDELIGAGLGQIFILFFLACVSAPIVEEIAFRGVFYRHLRESTVWLPRLLSVGAAGTVNSLIFAAIHPQGIFAIPVLFALALAFSLAREWRGSIVAPVVMHAMNNTVALTIIMLLFN